MSHQAVIIARTPKPREEEEELADQKRLFLPEYEEVHLEAKTFFVSEEILETRSFLEKGDD
jgi:hypothetical protein